MQYVAFTLARKIGHFRHARMAVESVAGVAHDGLLASRRDIATRVYAGAKGYAKCKECKRGIRRYNFTATGWWNIHDFLFWKLSKK